MEENDVKRIISRLGFIRSDLEAIRRLELNEELKKIVEEINERVEVLKGRLIEIRVNNNQIGLEKWKIKNSW